MDFIFQHPWIFLIAYTTIYGFVYKYRSKKYILESPELKEGYDRIFKGWMFYGNWFWIVMAIGDLTHLTKSIDELVNPHKFNPISVIWYVSILVIYFLGSRWIYFRGGAEMLAKHPGFLRFTGLGSKEDLTSAIGIKIFWTIMLIGGILGLTFMWII